jgi:hypothetical protein
MRKVALAIAASLVLAVVAPAFSQPFADVPTDHWAFDAIAELAAKGIVEGYPDGTFKGDRAMTRYEMAMVVARLLARIEAIKIPAPAPPAKVPPPEVSRADITTLQRLINEFRAELAALGVRVTAVEEELAALRARLDNVRITGDVRFRYNVGKAGLGADAGDLPRIRYRNRLTFTGKATDNITAVARASFGGGGGFGGSADNLGGRFDFDLAEPFAMQAVAFDLAYLDISGIFGLNWRLGQQAYTLSGTGYSGYGLLFDPSNADVFSPVGVADGLKVSGSWAGFSLEVGAWRILPVGGFVTGVDTDVWTARLGTKLAGWDVGLSYKMERSTKLSFSNTGWQVDAKGALFPGLTLGAAFAGYNPDDDFICAGVPCVSSNAWTVWAAWNLGGVMTGFSPTLSVWYKDFGSATATLIPIHTGATTELIATAAYTWDLRAWGVALDVQLAPSLGATFLYEAGEQKTTGADVAEYYVSFDWSMARNTTLSLRYFNGKLGAAPTLDFYRVQLAYSY